jgi:hypothetical protein
MSAPLIEIRPAPTWSMNANAILRQHPVLPISYRGPAAPCATSATHSTSINFLRQTDIFGSLHPRRVSLPSPHQEKVQVRFVFKVMAVFTLTRCGLRRSRLSN